MKVVGLAGGSSLCELGPAADVELFFECIHSFAVQRMSPPDISLLTDRLYKRYLREDEVEPASLLMKQLKTTFETISTAAVDLTGLSLPSAVTRLDASKANLAELFEKYFECFEHCTESAKQFSQTWKIWQPLRLVITDTREFIEDKKRPLTQYDDLAGRPFWLRHLPKADSAKG